LQGKKWAHHPQYKQLIIASLREDKHRACRLLITGKDFRLTLKTAASQCIIFKRRFPGSASCKPR
jgi:hypothetical protein